MKLTPQGKFTAVFVLGVCAGGLLRSDCACRSDPPRGPHSSNLRAFGVEILKAHSDEQLEYGSHRDGWNLLRAD